MEVCRCTNRGGNHSPELFAHRSMRQWPSSCTVATSLLCCAFHSTKAAAKLSLQPPRMLPYSSCAHES